MAFWSFIVLRILSPSVLILLRWLYRMEFHGLENIPATGPIILTPNHVSYLDPILVGIAVRRRLYFMTWDRLFEIPGLSQIMRIFGAYPVRLEGHDLNAIKRTQRHLRNGDAIVIFPEGGRTTTGKLDPFKPGAFRLALKLGVPTIPVTINGAYEVWPPNARLPRFSGKITIHYHAPLNFGACAEPEMKERTQQMLAETRQRIASSLDPTMIPEDLKEAGAET